MTLVIRTACMILHGNGANRPTLEEQPVTLLELPWSAEMALPVALVDTWDHMGIPCMIASVRVAWTLPPRGPVQRTVTMVIYPKDPASRGPLWWKEHAVPDSISSPSDAG